MQYDARMENHARMESRELVLRAIERRDPPRIPINYCNRDFDSSDTISVTWKPAASFVAGREGASEWGYVWEVLDGTMGQPRWHPLADWSRASGYVPPDPRAAGRFEGVREEIARWPGRFMKFGLGITGFNQATFLRGYDAFMTDLYEAPDRVDRVLDLVFEFENGLIDQALELPIDCVAFGDDWGTQKGLMIPLGLWRDLFLPRYADQFERVRRAGKKVWFHSCGDVFSIIGHLAEAGVDVIELLQPDLMGVERLAHEYGGRICFCCSVDHQRVAISGSREEIFAYASKLAETFGRFHGGFIAYIEDYASLGMSEQNYQWIRDAFHRIGGRILGEA